MEQIREPEKRTCVECKKKLNLNLFRADKDICRYCEIGQDNNFLIQEGNTQESTKFSKQIQITQKETIDNNGITKQNFTNHDMDKPKAIKADHIRYIYLKYIHLISIMKGSNTRWTIKKDVSKEIINCIKKSTDSITNEIISFNEKELNIELDKLINGLYIDVTIIKASLRTVLKSENKYKNLILHFAENLLIGSEIYDEAITILKEDLFTNKQELGYPIPIIKEHDAISKVKFNNNCEQIEHISYIITTRYLAKKINSNSYDIKKSLIREEVESYLIKNYVNQELSTVNKYKNQINIGVENGLVLFGLESYNISINNISHENFNMKSSAIF